MKKDLNYYLNLPYTITIKRLDDGDYFAQYADMGLTKNNLMAGWGATEAEAIADLKEAFACYVEGAAVRISPLNLRLGMRNPSLLR